MSKEKCAEAKQLMRQTLDVLAQCGQGKGASMAITHVEDAYLRLDFHMRQMGWIDQPVKAQTPAAPQRPVTKPQQPLRDNQVPPRTNLAPAQPVPRLRTGLMDSSPMPSAPSTEDSGFGDVSDVSLLP